jgi:hypothetical protein
MRSRVEQKSNTGTVTLKCCGEEVVPAIFKEMSGALGLPWFEVRDGQLVFVECMLCSKAMDAGDVQSLLSPAEFTAFCVGHCAFCAKKLTVTTNLSSCAKHYHCTDCPSDKCRICEAFNAVAARMDNLTVFAFCCKCREVPPAKGFQLLECYHGLCGNCKAPLHPKHRAKGNKRNKNRANADFTAHCPACDKPKKILRVRMIS